MPPSPEQFRIAELVSRALIRNLPQTGIMDGGDVLQMANEALVALVEEGKAPADPGYLGGAIRHKLIDRLRKEGALSRSRAGGVKRIERREVALPEDQPEQSSVLTPGEREVLRMSFEDDLTPAGIAELTGRTENSVAVSKRGALRALRGELMPRALEALEASANGCSIIETARLMHCSQETIKSYRKQAIAALGAHNTTHAAVLAVRRGLLE